jgi:mannose-6-phosphate isomerase-like protein (cupin superfamily)
MKKKKTFNQAILYAITLPFCSVIENGTIMEKPGNSVVHALFPSPSLIEVIEKLIPSFSEFFAKKLRVEDFQFGINHVKIDGLLEEELHVHVSCIIAIVVFGSGTVIYERYGRVFRKKVKEGDIIIVPQNAPYYFVSEGTVIYTGIEIGPVIDYQKHHKH